MNRARSLLFVALTLPGSIAMAQEAVEQAPPPAGSQDQMDKMAATVTSMAEVCQQMMNQEMAAMPYKIAAGIGIGALITLVLLLLLVLEVQWIVYWRRLLRVEKRESRGGSFFPQQSPVPKA